MFNLRYFIIFQLFAFIYAQSLQDLQKKYKEFEKDELQIDQQNKQVQRTQFDLPSETIIMPYLIPAQLDSLDRTPKHFGYNFFTKRDTISFWESLPAPANYLLGPGDELVISIWGQTQLRQTYTITKDGKIYDEKVGLMNLSGKTVEDAQKYLFNQFGRIYATLKGQNPSTFMDISLGQLRSINVNFVGEVKFPGVYPVHPFSNAITGLIQAGGIDTTGSLRNIIIKREGKEYKKIDLYNYFLKGDLPDNIQLRDQDVLVVPPRSSFVVIDSAVVRAGIYESLPGETVGELIGYAGGLMPDASATIGLERIIPIEERNGSQLNYTKYYVEYSNSYLTPVRSGDKIVVRRIFYLVNNVEIIGQVKTPGKYYFNEGMKLRDLINLGGGLSDTTFWKSVYQPRSEIVRRDPNTRYEKVIEIDLQKLLKDNNELYNIPLQNLDRFVVHANLNFFEKENIQILGEVNIPGSYPLILDNETLKSILSRAGSLTSRALENGISIYRDKKYFKITENNEELDRVRVAWSNQNVILMPGDSIVVKETTKTVNVTGGVYNPGLIEFKSGKSINYYLNAAGGLNELGNKKGIIVVYANGVVSPKKWYKNPQIYDGTTIIVNQKELGEPFNLTQFATNWTSIISSLVSVFVLSQQIGGSN